MFLSDWHENQLTEQLFVLLDYQQYQEERFQEISFIDVFTHIYLGLEF